MSNLSIFNNYTCYIIHHCINRTCDSDVLMKYTLDWRFQMKRKLLAIVLITVMLVSMLPAFCFADSTTYGALGAGTIEKWSNAGSRLLRREL